MKLSITLVAVTLGAALGLASCNLAGRGTDPPTLPRSPSASESVAAPGSEEEVRGVTPGELRDLLDKGQAIVIDVRTEPQYREGHIQGALLMPKRSLQAMLSELPADKLIVSYCACPAEHLSLDASLAIRRGGRQNVAVLLGGLRAWVKEGFPTEPAIAK